MTRADRWLPDFQFEERHEARIHAGPQAVDRAVREVTLSEVAVNGSVTLSTTTRVHLEDESVRWRFGGYWGVVAPFSALIRVRMLRAIRRRAESAR